MVSNAEAPIPSNVVAVKFNGQITINWDQPSQDSDAVAHYLVDILNGDSPYEVDGTQYVFSVEMYDPAIVYVMAVDICGNTSVRVEAEVMDLGTATTTRSTGKYDILHGIILKKVYIDTFI